MNYTFKRFFTLLLLLVTGMTTAFGQATARIQVIHNSPTPTVDIYANGALLLDNFAFRTATPFITVPANVNLNLGVGLGTSRSVADTLVNFRVRLDSGKTYLVFANGIVGNATRPFTLAVYDLARERSANANNVDIQFFHGSPDAPQVDILAGNNVLFDNISYGGFATYASVPAATYQLSVTPGNDNSNRLATYNADFSFWRGNSAVVFASGFLNGGTPTFEPWVALSNGGTFPLSRVSAPPPPPPAATNTARLQIIHNSPTPTVDIYVNGSLLLDNFVFRTATPYLTVPAGVTLNVGVALGTSTSVRDTLVNFPVRLDSGRTYVVVANGIVGNATRPFNLAVNANGRVNGTNANNVDISFFHGSPDAPEVDILAGTSVLFDNYSYGRFAPYVSVPATSYTLAVTPSTDNNTIVARYAADFGFWKGNTATVFASGFLAANGNPAFEPWVALSNGGTFPLRRVSGFAGNPIDVQSAQRNRQASDNELRVLPNPASDYLNIGITLTQDFDVTAQIFNLTGQVVRSQNVGNRSKGSSEFSMSLDGLASGYYLLRVDMPEGTLSRKVMIVK
jgi:hypothetical protein